MAERSGHQERRKKEVGHNKAGSWSNISKRYSVMMTFHHGNDLLMIADWTSYNVILLLNS
jgi:hypothetical protein